MRVRDRGREATRPIPSSPRSAPRTNSPSTRDLPMKFYTNPCLSYRLAIFRLKRNRLFTFTTFSVSLSITVLLWSFLAWCRSVKENQSDPISASVKWNLQVYVPSSLSSSSSSMSISSGFTTGSVSSVSPLLVSPLRGNQTKQRKLISRVNTRTSHPRSWRARFWPPRYK